MKGFKYIYILAIVAIFTSSCKDSVLDKPPLTSYIDDSKNYWRNEDDLRLFGNGFYLQYFNGYNSGFGVDYTPLRGYNFSDDVTKKNVQSHFETVVPSSRGSAAEGAAWLGEYAGPSWNFSWVRKANLFIDRIDNVAKPQISADAYKHWSAVAKFFRGFEYSRLVSVFGDVPYFDRVVGDDELTVLFKDRDSRGLVMDKVYDDFKYVLQNIRENDGTNMLNKNIAAAFISRFMLFEGTYQQYHGLDAARAKKYLEFSAEAAEVVMTSNKFNFTRDFKSIFASESLAGHPEVLMYRIYDAALLVTHAVGSYSNGTETVGLDANLNLVKSFIVNDGKVYQNSTVPNANSFTVADLAKTRDPRFEATFISRPLGTATTLLYSYKFASRDAITYIGSTPPAIWASSTNTSDAPVIRLAEVVLNWIEARTVLAENHGGSAIAQGDLDKSINAIRNRPLDAAAIAKGVAKTQPLLLAALPVDPSRDADVSPLMWEIRRERRMEFFAEHTRLLDLKRWKKLNYMNFSTSPDYLLGPWVNLQTEIPSALVNGAKVRKADGTIVTYSSSAGNAANMVGYWVVESGANRNAFSDKNYLSPVGQNQITEYQEKGYTLTQTKNW